MCVGSIVRLEDRWESEGAPLGRLDDGCVVPLSFVPDARPRSYLLLHLGIPVEVLDPATAREALALRTPLGADRPGDADDLARPHTR
jgi:hydrogenase maturation factor